MKKLIIIEGLPGSGKTTLAKKLHQSISAFTSDAQVFVEGDLHPVDMAWCACLTTDQYIELCFKYPNYVKAFEENKSQWNDYVLIAYTKIENITHELFHFFESHEVYDGRVGKELFCGLHKSRWAKFGKEASGINIFECILLQNHVNELLLFHCEAEEKISIYIKELIETIVSLKPLIVYLDINSEKSIKRAADERIDNNGNPVWESRVSEYITNSPYGMKHGLIGSLGMYSYFAKRKKVELEILDQLPVEKYVIPINIENQIDMEEQFIQKICKQISEW